MSNSWLVSHGAPVACDDSTTRYAPLAGWLNLYASEADAQHLVRVPGKFSKAAVWVTQNDSSNNSVVALSVNMATTLVHIDIPSGATGLFTETGNQMVVFGTEEVAWTVAVLSEPGSHSLTISTLGIMFTPDNSADCMTLLAAGSEGSISLNSITRYSVPNGKFGALSSEDFAKVRIRGDFVASHFFARVSNNTRTTDTIFKSRVNGADGGMAVTVPAGASGFFEDSAGSDTLAAGDDFDYVYTTSTGGGSLDLRRVGCQFLTRGGRFLLMAGEVSQGDFLPNTTRFVPVAGHLRAEPTEAIVALAPHFEFTAGELMAQVSNNTLASGTANVTLRDDGVESLVALAIPAGATGVFLDSAHTAVISPGDEADYKVTTPSTTGLLTITNLGVLGTPATQGQPPRSMHQFRERRAA